MPLLASIFGKKVTGIDVSGFGTVKCTAYRFLGITYVKHFRIRK